MIINYEELLSINNASNSISTIKARPRNDTVKFHVTMLVHITKLTGIIDSFLIFRRQSNKSFVVCVEKIDLGTVRRLCLNGW